MRRQVEGTLHQLREGLAVQLLEIREARAELAERGEGRRREAGLRLEELANRAAARRGQRPFELAPPVIRGRRTGDEIDELGVPEQSLEIRTRLVGNQPCRGARELAEQRVPQQHLQQAGVAARRLRIRPGENQLLDVRLGEQCGDVVGLQLPPRRDFTGLDQRREYRAVPVGVPHLREPRPPGQAHLEQGRDLRRIAFRHRRTQEALQVLQEMAAEDAARPVRAGERVGAHDIREIGIGIRLILAIADPGY